MKTVVGATTLAVLLQGCASAGPVTRPLTTPATELEAELLEATRPGEPAVLIFGWRLNERGSRIEGRGVARVEPPDRVRLDLFTENGETAARAALVQGDLRVPPDVDRRLVPPPALLWASLGVFHPGSDAELLGGERLLPRGQEGDAGIGRDTATSASGAPATEPPSPERIRLRYRTSGGQEARFVFEGRQLQSAELVEGSSVVERVELERGSSPNLGSGEPYPSAAVYRDRSAFRELRVTLEESREPGDTFPPDIWLPEW